MNKRFLLCFHDKNYLQDIFKSFACDYALNKAEAYSRLIANDYNAIFFSEEFLRKNKFFISIFVNEICPSKPPLMVISESYYFLPDLISVREKDLTRVLNTFKKELLEPVKQDKPDVFKNLIKHVEELSLFKRFYDIILKEYKTLDQCFLEIIEIVDVVLLPELFVIGRSNNETTEYFVSPNSQLTDKSIKEILYKYKLGKGKLIFRNNLNIKHKHERIPEMDFTVKKHILSGETVFSIIGTAKSNNHGDTQKLIEILQSQIKTITFYMSSLLKQHKMYITDYLTGVYNRRFFDETLTKELYRSKRHKKSFILIFFDIDNFKNINDEFGHSIGDQILISLTAYVDSLTRDSDIFARLGGEEFGILLPETDSEGGHFLAEKIRRQVAEKVFEVDSCEINLTISAGMLAVRDFEQASYNRIYNMSDNAMYKAKSMGKNKVVVSEL